MWARNLIAYRHWIEKRGGSKRLRSDFTCCHCHGILARKLLEELQMIFLWMRFLAKISWIQGDSIRFNNIVAKWMNIRESAKVSHQPSHAEAILWPGQLEQLHVTWTWWSLLSHWIKQRLSEVRSGILLKLLSTCEVTLRPQKKNQMSNKPRFSTTKQAITVQSCWHSGCMWPFVSSDWSFSCPHFGQDWAVEFVWKCPATLLSFEDGLSKSHAGTATVGRRHRAICSG